MANQRLGMLFAPLKPEEKWPSVQIWERGQVPDQYRDVSFYSYVILIPRGVRSPMDVQIGQLIPWHGEVVSRVEYENGNTLLRVQ